jgi:potassium voltage-gated channel Eag-related subfamily H protein 7
MADDVLSRKSSKASLVSTTSHRSQVKGEGLVGLYKHTQKYLIDPNQKKVRRWDAVVTAALLFTGAFTPFEVAFIDTVCFHPVLGLNPLFAFNRLIDFVFFCDMILQFFLMKEVETDNGVVLIKDHRTLACLYVQSWFALDLVSILPYDLVGCLDGGSSMFSNLRIFRVIRLFRLLKLLRLAKASRILARWEANLSLSTTARAMLTGGTTLVLGCHWCACVWGGLGRELRSSGLLSWIDALAAGKGPDTLQFEHPLTIYLGALHYAAMTITSIGYGDIAPQQSSEYAVGILLQGLGGITWAFVIGIFSSLLTVSNPAQQRYRQTMDELNHMMETQRMQNDVRIELRTFFMMEKTKNETEIQMAILSRLSPKLRTKISTLLYGRACRSVYYFKFCSERFVEFMAQGLVVRVYPQAEEICLPAQLCFINRGIVVMGGAVKGRDKCFGDDFMLAESLRATLPILALTFVELLCLSAERYREVMEAAEPEDYKKVRRWVCRLTLLRGVKVSAQRYREAKERETVAQGGVVEKKLSIFGGFEAKLDSNRSGNIMLYNDALVLDTDDRMRKLEAEVRQVKDDVQEMRTKVLAEVHSVKEELLREMHKALANSAAPLATPPAPAAVKFVAAPGAPAPPTEAPAPAGNAWGRNGLKPSDGDQATVPYRSHLGVPGSKPASRARKKEALLDSARHPNQTPRF